MYGNAPLSYLTGVPGWESEAEQTLLYELAQTVPAGGIILEIGGEFGMSASLFCKGADPTTRIITIDLFPDELLAHHQGNLDEAGFGGRSEQMQGHSSQVVDDFEFIFASANPDMQGRGAIDLLFIDGDHSCEGVLADLNNWAGFVKPGGLLVLHDVACSTNLSPHYLHFEVSRALADWIDAEIWVSVKSVDSTLVLRRVGAREETEPAYQSDPAKNSDSSGLTWAHPAPDETKYFDNPPEFAIRAEDVAAQVKAAQVENENTQLAKVSVPYEEMTRANLLQRAAEKGLTFPANVRTATIIRALQQPAGE